MSPKTILAMEGLDLEKDWKFSPNRYGASWVLFGLLFATPCLAHAPSTGPFGWLETVRRMQSKPKRVW